MADQHPSRDDESPRQIVGDIAYQLLQALNAGAKVSDYMRGRMHRWAVELQCVESRLLQSESGDSELRLLRRACDAAFAFIDSHVADPDLTNEMILKHATYLEARAQLEGRRS